MTVQICPKHCALLKLSHLILFTTLCRVPLLLFCRWETMAQRLYLPTASKRSHREWTCQGTLMQHPGPPRMKNKTTKTWSAWGGRVANLSKEKGLDPFPPWAFIRFIGIGMQIKLINHCQPVRVKQYRIYREPPGLCLRQSARRP